MKLLVLIGSAVMLAGCSLLWDAQGYGTDERPYVLGNGESKPLVEITPDGGPDGAALSINLVDPVMLGIEGYVVFGRLKAQDGTIVMDMRIPNEGIDVTVPGGTYAFTAYYRNCDGNCGFLDPPENLCATDVTTVPEAGATITVSVGKQRCTTNSN